MQTILMPLYYMEVIQNNHFDTTTWMLRNNTFTPLLIPGPGVRSQSAMVYDKRRKKVVLYGGAFQGDELWEFDGNKWEKIIREVNPGIKMYHQMVYDESKEVVILHGGQINHRPLDPKNLETPYTWSWDGKQWKQIDRQKIFPIAMGYHPERKSVMAYGFNDGNDTVTRSLGLWELQEKRWVKLEDYGVWNTLDFLENHLKTDSENTMAHYAYAIALRKLRRYPEAEAVYKKIDINQFPEKANIYFGLIDVLKGQQKWAEAEKYIHAFESIGNRRRLSTLYYDIACYCAQAGDTERAFRLLHKAIDFGFDSKKEYESDPDLEPLRKASAWQEVLNRLK